MKKKKQKKDGEIFLQRKFVISGTRNDHCGNMLGLSRGSAGRRTLNGL